jgi:hypothetical protein
MAGFMRQTGFSLIEVNMAVFVLAIGVLSIAVLYPLGMRESSQSQGDLHQAMFADAVLNTAVAAASQTNLPWEVWKEGVEYDPLKWDAKGTETFKDVPDYIKNAVKALGLPESRFRMGCIFVRGASQQVMGILVQSTELSEDTDSARVKRLLDNSPIYYTEVRFQGIATNSATAAQKGP